MRIHGTLIKWNDDRGFGFIKPAKGDSEIFVHVSAFPRDGVRPRVEEIISFEVETGKDGRQRAVRVMRPGPRREARKVRTPARSQVRRVWRQFVFALIFVGIGASLFSRFKDAPSSVPFYESDPLVEEEVSRRFQCDGRTRCSQMTSCEEATYFIRNCPNAEMDGDNDGVPCERQWCN